MHRSHYFDPRMTMHKSPLSCFSSCFCNLQKKESRQLGLPALKLLFFLDKKISINLIKTSETHGIHVAIWQNILPKPRPFKFFLVFRRANAMDLWPFFSAFNYKLVQVLSYYTLTKTVFFPQQSKLYFHPKLSLYHRKITYENIIQNEQVLWHHSISFGPKIFGPICCLQIGWKNRRMKGRNFYSTSVRSCARKPKET